MLHFLKLINAQEYNCSTSTHDVKYNNFLKEISSISNNYQTSNRAIREIAINMILIQYNNGTIISPQDAMQVVEDANVLFANANMHFNLCNISMAPYPYAQYPNFNEMFDYQVENFIAATYYKPGYLNIYYAKNTPQNATLPNSNPLYNAPRIVTSQAGVIILAHELGHFFSLIHTHVNNQYDPLFITDELVNGSNCSTAGDFICDTPADPGLFAFRMAPAPACQYIDTVTTDINGDLYNPIVNNYMSALSHCTNSFTPEQYSRMAYIAEHHRAYLKTGAMNFSIDSLPAQVCVTDSSIALSSSYPGGIFSGNGVSGNQFYPAVAGPGNHIINYTMPININTIETTDAFFFYTDTLYHTNNLTQSFQVENDGVLTGFAFGVQSNTNQNINFTLYNGNNINGSIVQQGSISINTNASWDWIKSSLNNIPVIAGEFYTMKYSFSDSVQIVGSKGNYYLSGESNYINDIDFISYIIPTNGNCSNTYSVNIFVSSPTEIFSDQIFDSYCASSPISFPEFEPVGGIISINNTTDTTINASLLGSGQHFVSYTYNNNIGCISVKVDTFEVASTATIDLANNSVFCSSDPGVYVTTGLDNGNLYIDGNLISNNFIDIPNLNIGNHVISFSKNSSNYEWIEIDQQNYVNQSPGGFSINGTGQYWQSFTADKNGYLSSIKLAISSPLSMNVNYKIYLGEGIFSFPIYSGISNIGGQGFFYHSFNFPDSTIEMIQDSIYTFQISYQGNYFTEVLGDYTNNYIRGKNNYSTQSSQSDYWFKTYVKPNSWNCSADSTSTIFEITPSISVNLGQDTIIAMGQSITLDAGNVGNSYLWSTGDTTQTITINGNQGTNMIWVVVTSSSGCLASDTILIDMITNTNASLNEGNINIYPNPVNDFIEISTDNPIEIIELMDMLGQLVMIKWASNYQNHFVVNTESLASGIYTLHIKQGFKHSYLKILKQ